VILRNHGLLAWGRTLPECFYTLWLMQRACEIQLAGAALGPTLPIGPAVQAACADAAERFYARKGMGDDILAALLRQVDRIDRGWRD
jgi:ribulose-5-phosphate 4-epimerase/fuculose-1-phosphate aldolase